MYVVVKVKDAELQEMVMQAVENMLEKHSILTKRADNESIVYGIDWMIENLDKVQLLYTGNDAIEEE